jgi:hypothetical protein
MESVLHVAGKTPAEHEKLADATQRVNLTERACRLANGGADYPPQFDVESYLRRLQASYRTDRCLCRQNTLCFSSIVAYLAPELAWLPI